jgi:transposase InsO family protein
MMMVYAMEIELYLGSTFAVLIELPEGRDVSSGPVSRVLNLASNGLPLDQSLQRDGPRRTRGSQPPPAYLFARDARAMENAILVLRAKHPSWGARKLKARLEMLQPELVWPAASTFGNILSRAGLTSPQRKRKRTTPCSEPFSLVTGPNQLWCMDFKGYFATGDGKRCDPFTITDAHSRYLIRCQIVS